MAHFYDPPLRSFLFQDFHLTPALDEFQGLLGFSIKGRTPYNMIGQVGYPMLGKPEDKELEGMILDDMGSKDPALLYKIVRSWEKIHTKGPELRKRDGMSRTPYWQWVL
ncbi:hypothetical protein KIW84_052391 [Lathyrus oleraceus]|uniref:DUF7745 domain-containing protein n=1 Tax=Pisum sativum TaxID=3888 RepID=A0A9D4WMJ7_PEA|nr:hypothetical protein KIW84_052391 [Pisum sativum]